MKENEYILVEETVQVTRYHLVKANKKSACKKVRECADESLYLHSCDDIHWDTAKYAVGELPDNWTNDLKLRQTARHIEERLSQEIPESDLTKRRKSGKMSASKSPKKKPPKSLLSKLKEIE